MYIYISCIYIYMPAASPVALLGCFSPRQAFDTTVLSAVKRNDFRPPKGVDSTKGSVLRAVKALDASNTEALQARTGVGLYSVVFVCCSFGMPAVSFAELHVAFLESYRLWQSFDTARIVLPPELLSCGWALFGLVYNGPFVAGEGARMGVSSVRL